MYDTITLAALAGIHPLLVLAGYTAGHWPTYLTLVRTYRRAKVKSIAIFASLHAMCLDVEPGDADPSQVVGWIRADRAAGFRKPCVYSSLWEYVNQIKPRLAAAGIALSSIWKWDADFRGCNGIIDPGFDGTQCTDHAFNRSLDQSVITTAFAGLVVPKPKPPARPVCFGSHPQHSALCRRVQKQDQGYQRAVASSRRALAGVQHTLVVNHCQRPYRRGVCVRAGRGARTFNHRISYFGAKSAALHKSYS